MAVITLAWSLTRLSVTNFTEPLSTVRSSVVFIPVVLRPLPKFSSDSVMLDTTTPPSSPSYTVSSPRRTLSLVRKKRTKYKSPEASAWEREERKDRPITGGPSGPKPSEVYGFVGAITTVVATSIFLVWAYTPESWLHWLGITYYPSKYWALAIPTYAMVTVVLAMVFYVAMNFMITPSPTSFNTIFDEYSREPVEHVSLGSDEERPIEPISDIGINYINDLMFGGAS